jgi:hypothetical protein
MQCCTMCTVSFGSNGSRVRELCGCFFCASLCACAHAWFIFDMSVRCGYHAVSCCGLGRLRVHKFRVHVWLRVCACAMCPMCHVVLWAR